MGIVSLISASLDLTKEGIDTSNSRKIYNINTEFAQGTPIGYESRLVSLRGGVITKTIHCIEEFVVISIMTGSISILVCDIDSNNFSLLSIGDSHASKFARIAKNSLFSIKVDHFDTAVFQIIFGKSMIIELKADAMLFEDNLINRWEKLLAKDLMTKNFNCQSSQTGVLNYDDDHFIISNSDLSLLKQCANDSPLKRSRICFHSDPSSKLQVMLIYMHCDSKINPAMHMDKAESITLLHGTANYKIYPKLQDEEAITLTSVGCYNTSSVSFINTSKYVIHQLVPTSLELIFLESTIGPFNRNGTIEFDCLS